MPRNDKNIKSKDVVGKKYISHSFVVTIFLCLLWLLLIIVSIAKTGSYQVGLICCAMTSIIVVPTLIYDILRSLGIIGQYCIVAEDRLYYFKARTVIRGKFEKSNGYVLYSEIKNVSISESWTGGKKHSDVVIQGDKFEIVIENSENLSKKLVNEIKRRANIDDGKLRVYDKIGKCYNKYSDIVYYDKSDREYKINGDMIIDQNDTKYDREYCYIDSNGYFYYNEKEMDFYDSLDEDFVEYYTDGKEIYVFLRYFVYWDELQKMYCYDGTRYYELSDFNNKEKTE